MLPEDDEGGWSGRKPALLGGFRSRFDGIHYLCFQLHSKSALPRPKFNLKFSRGF